jgi:uncharacterized RDD family membrane protein YckC
MLTEKTPYRRYPKVPIERRAAAFLIDFVTVWLVSSFFGVALQWLVFLIGWLALRVIAVEKNKGQSLGSYALDLKVIDARFNKIPGLLALAKREGIIGFAAMLAMLGLNINFGNGLSMLLLVTPLVVECATALGDEPFNQAFHDKIAETIVIQTRRGFSLDLRLKKLYLELKRSMQNMRK